MNQTWMASRILVCLLLLSVLAQAQNPGPSKPKIGREIDVRCLYPAGTYCDYGVLFPLVLEYHNKSLVPQPFRLSWSLRVPIPQEYQNIVLEPGAKKRIPLLLPPGSINQLYSLEVNEQNISVGVSSNSQGRIGGLLTPDADNFGYIKSMPLVKNPYFNAAENSDETEYNTLSNLSDLDHEVFPEHWAALDALDVVVGYDLTSLGLGDHQYQALVNWVRQGGELVVVSNGVPTEYRGTPLEQILPLSPTDIASEKDRIRVRGALKPGTGILVGSEGEEVLLERDVLKGKVYYVTIPILEPEVLGEGETELLWRHVFDKQPSYNNGPHTFSMMKSIPELPRTRAAWVALFVILYGIIVGPVNLTILRKKDKMLWSFVTVPVVAIVFAGSAYVVNRVIRPSTPVLRELGYLTLQVDQKVGYAESEQLLFSPDGQVFTVSANSATFFETSANNYSAFGGPPREFGLYKQTAEGGLQSTLKMGTWDIQRFQARSSIELESPFLVKQLPNDEFQITAPMDSAADHAVVFLPGSGTSKPFSLKSGQNTYKLEFTGGNPNQNIVWDEEKNPGREDLLSALHNTRAATTGKLYFWNEDLTTSLATNAGTLTRHDYLVCVEFEVD